MDKAKIIEGAAKLVAKGAYDKAIKEYQKVLEADPRDVRVLQKMGELYQKKNDNQEAANYFTRVAESYSQDGFFLKAVALYKQVLKLNPDLLDVNLKLAELHQQLGLMSEATAYFQLVANHYEKQGDTKASLDTLKKMVDLDPENTTSRTKLAELYAREGMKADAVTEFRKVADFLKRSGRADDYLRVAERISAVEPDNVELARELAQSYLGRGDQKRALAKLQICFKTNPRDVGTLTMLADAFSGLGQVSKTISVLKELIKVHSDEGRPGDAGQLWERIRQLDPNDAELAERAAPRGRPSAAPAAPARAAEARAAPAPAAPDAGSSSGLRRDQLVKLLTETDVYVKYGLHDKALEHLRRVFQVDPENLEAHEKAYHIYVHANQAQEASEQLLNVLRLCTRRNEVERGQSYLEKLLEESPDHEELPAFLEVLRPDGAGAAAGDEDAILVDSADEEVVVSEAPEDALAVRRAAGLERGARSAPPPAPVDDEAVVLEDEAVELSDEPLSGEAVPIEVDEAGAEPELVVDDADGAVPLEAGEDPALELAAEGHDASSEVVSLEVDEGGLQEEVPATDEEVLAVDEGPGAAFEEPVEAPPEDEEDPVAGELEEAGFFVDQGLYDEAREALETVMLARPGHPKAQELLDRVNALEKKARAAPRKAAEKKAAPPRPPPKVELKPEESKDAFDLAAELAEELGELGEEEAPAAPSASTDDFQYSVEEVFTEFKKGLEKVVKPEDVETHYDLGIAYKEMGLVDDAIGEFQIARQGCAGKRKEIDCLTMTALLQGMKGDHAAAVESLRQALASEHATGDTAKALGFELGTAYEAQGSPGKALFHFQRVAQADPGYRDVKAHVARLAQIAKPEEDSLPKGRGNGAAKASPSAPPARPGLPKAPEPSTSPSGGKARKVGYL